MCRARCGDEDRQEYRIRASLDNRLRIPPRPCICRPPRTRPGAKAADGGGTKNTLCEAPTQTNDDDGQPTAKSYDPQCGSNGEMSSDQHASEMIERSVAGGTTDPMGPRRDVDYQGRTWRTVTKDPDAATGDIHVDLTYNARDRVAASTAPYYAGQAETYATRHEYDALDRPARVTHPDGAYTSTSYGLWSVTRTDELGHAKTDRHNAEGRRVAHEEVVDDAVATTTYVYDERGHLIRSTDPLGNVITYETRRWSMTRSATLRTILGSAITATEGRSRTPSRRPARTRTGMTTAA